MNAVVFIPTTGAFATFGAFTSEVLWASSGTANVDRQWWGTNLCRATCSRWVGRTWVGVLCGGSLAENKRMWSSVMTSLQFGSGRESANDSRCNKVELLFQRCSIHIIWVRSHMLHVRRNAQNTWVYCCIRRRPDTCDFILHDVFWCYLVDGRVYAVHQTRQNSNDWFAQLDLPVASRSTSFTPLGSACSIIGLRFLNGAWFGHELSTTPTAICPPSGGFDSWWCESYITPCIFWGDTLVAEIIIASNVALLHRSSKYPQFVAVVHQHIVVCGLRNQREWFCIIWDE